MEEYLTSTTNQPFSRVRYDFGVDSKIVVMGNSGVGKTSLLQRYTLNKFTKHTTSTSGALFVTKKVNIGGVKVRLQLWDTAGQERFRSMAPMYYRGANAALLLYDITDKSSFSAVRGWLEELKSNCSPDLIIYIVGAKADLHDHRQVTSDLARLNLHNWFPPPSDPSTSSSNSHKTSDQEEPTTTSSTLSYIRPRFTSFPGLSSTKAPPDKDKGRSSPPTPPSNTSSSPSTSSTASYAASPTSFTTTTSATSYSTRPSSLIRSKTSSNTDHGFGGTRPRRTSAGAALLTRSNTTGASHAMGGKHGHSHSISGIPGLTSTTKANSKSPINTRFGFKPWGHEPIQSEDCPDENDGVCDGEHGEDGDLNEGGEDGEGKEWGLEPGMELFEVSAKDNTGIQNLFDHLIHAIIERLDKIEAENERKRRDSVFLGSSANVATPGWAAQAEEEEARLEKERREAGKGGVWGGFAVGGGCCA